METEEIKSGNDLNDPSGFLLSAVYRLISVSILPRSTITVIDTPAISPDASSKRPLRITTDGGWSFFEYNGIAWGKNQNPHALAKRRGGVEGKLGYSGALFVLIDGEASDLLFAVGFQLRLELCTGTEAALAASVERAARRWVQRAGQFTRQLDAFAA